MVTCKLSYKKMYVDFFSIINRHPRIGWKTKTETFYIKNKSVAVLGFINSLYVPMDVIMS